jgi:hypothetical protein
MKKLILVAALLSSPAVARDDVVKEPVCQPTGRTSKGDLVYSMECRNPGLKAGKRVRSSPSDNSENYPDQA